MPMRGGWTRDNFRRGILRKGASASAELRSIEPMTSDNTALGLSKWDMTIEVRPESGAPYELQGVFRAPDDAGALPAGTILPVKIHPKNPKRVAIDWESFTFPAL